MGIKCSFHNAPMGPCSPVPQPLPSALGSRQRSRRPGRWLSASKLLEPARWGQVSGPASLRHVSAQRRLPGRAAVARRPHCSPARPCLSSTPSASRLVASDSTRRCSVCRRVPGEASWSGRQPPRREWTLLARPSNRRPSPRGSRAK